MSVDVVLGTLQRCASQHGSPEACAVVQLPFWLEAASSQASGTIPGPVLVAVVSAFSAGAVGDGSFRSLEERKDSIIGLEQCLSLGASCLDFGTQEALTNSVLDGVLPRYDATGDALAVDASRQVLHPDCRTAEVTEALRAVLALLLRALGTERFTAKELLELVRGDVALAVATIAEALAAPAPIGVPKWHVRMVQVLHSLTAPDAFMWLLERAYPGADFNSMPIADLQARQLIHGQAVTLALVQFDAFEHVLRVAGEQAVRQAVLASFVRCIHNLVSGHHLEQPGRLLSRCVMLDFLRLGFRFLAPFIRKLVDESREPSARRLLRHTARTLSWLLVHAEADRSTFLAESLRPLSAEWLLRAVNVAGAPPAALIPLVVLAANTGAMDPQKAPGAQQILSQVQGATAKLYGQLEEDVRRCPAVTEVGHAGLCSMGYMLLPLEDLMATAPGTGGEDDEYYMDGVDVDDYEFDGFLPWEMDPAETAVEEGMSVLEDSAVCNECGQDTYVGSYGEGYFDGLWYCQRCWGVWQSAPPDQPTLSPFPLACGSLEPGEQRGAAVLLLRAPEQLRCGIDGRLLSFMPLQIPGSSQAAYSVAFARRALERWHRRSGGRCPLTGQPLDMRFAVESPLVLETVKDWVESSLSLANV